MDKLESVIRDRYNYHLVRVLFGVMDKPLASRGRFYLHVLTLISSWISNRMPSEMWGDSTLHGGCNYFSMLELNHVSKRGPCIAVGLSIIFFHLPMTQFKETLSLKRLLFESWYVPEDSFQAQFLHYVTPPLRIHGRVYQVVDLSPASSAVLMLP